MIRVYLSGDPIHDRVLLAFYDGISGEKELVRGFEYKLSDIAVVFGVHKSKVPKSFPRGKVFQQQRAKNLDVIVLETGYINRGDGEHHHYAAGFNGLNGRADFRNKGMSDDRAILLRKNHGLRCLDWRKEGSHILLCGQVPWDASVEMCSDYPDWLRFITGQIKYHTKREIRFRPHPLAKLPPIKGCTYSTAPLREDLEDCWATVSFNSNSSVESVIEGVPAFTFDAGSMAKEVSSQWLQEIERPHMPDRHQWLNDLAYTQWTLNEMREGQAWKHLMR